jgi:glycosyltransferase involved in cell wall biosynthesis
VEKIAGLVPFQILPAQFGGAERCWNILSRLGPVDVFVSEWDQPDSTFQVDDVRFKVVNVGEDANLRADTLMTNGWFKTYDAMPHMARAFLDRFRDAVESANPDLIVLEHPWLIDFVGDRPFIYDAHNAEAFHYGVRFGVEVPEYLHIKELERRAVQGAKAVTYCSEADADILRKAYGDFQGVHIPNGVTLPTYDNGARKNVLLFVGGLYPPNIHAAQALINLAPQLPEFEVVIVGSCGQWVQPRSGNVQLLGHVNDDVLDALFRQASVFVNLVSQGSGTHLKVGRALAYGVPVITSQIGARGYSSPIVTDDPVSTIRQVMSQWETYSEEARLEALGLDWDTVVAPMRELVGR